MAQLTKNPPAVQETWVPSLGWEDPLEKGKATHSRILARRIPWTVWSMGSQSRKRVSDFHFQLRQRLSLRVNRRVTFTYTVGARLYFSQISDIYIFNDACGWATSGPQLLGKTILTLIVTSFFSTSGLWTTLTPSRKSRLRRLFFSCPNRGGHPNSK